MAGEKLKMPLSNVPYQLDGGMVSLTSKAKRVKARQDAGFLQVMHPVGEHPSGDDDERRRRSR